MTEHYYHNREWWRRRVRMVTPNADLHASNVMMIHSLVQNEPGFKEYYTDDVRLYFDSFEKKCRDGLFEELSDVNLFQHDGTDSNGLYLCLRLRGSNRAENLYHKMMS